LVEVLLGFASLGLGSATLQAVADLGFDIPTALQELAIPLLLQGRDVVVQAPTGTGKTAAYGPPIVERLNEPDLRTQALVLVPTRELAIQVAEALHGVGKHRQMVTLPVYGGQPYERQFRALARGVQVVVGTPGRLLDHLARKTLALDTVRIVILDEADEMLDRGFVEDIERILAALPPGHQTALFSATIPARVQTLARKYLQNPEHLSERLVRRSLLESGRRATRFPGARSQRRWRASSTWRSRNRPSSSSARDVMRTWWRSSSMARGTSRRRSTAT